MKIHYDKSTIKKAQCPLRFFCKLFANYSLTIFPSLITVFAADLTL
jgi:hypothetical protein